MTKTTRPLARRPFLRDELAPTSLPRPDPQRTTFWMCCAVHCIPATAATNEIVIRHHGQSFGSVHTDLAAGMLTFLLMLATFFIFYLRPAPWTMLWITSSRTSRTTATQTESWTPNGPTSSRSVQCVLPRFEDNEAQTYVAYRDSATQLDYLDLNYHAPAVQHNVGTQASLAQPQHEAPRPPSPTDSSGISLREAKKINATLGREVRSLRARVAGLPWRQARADDIGNVFLCPGGNVWHHSATCARQRSSTKSDPIVRRPCWYCTNEVVQVPPHPQQTAAASSQTPRP